MPLVGGHHLQPEKSREPGGQRTLRLLSAAATGFGHSFGQGVTTSFGTMNLLYFNNFIINDLLNSCYVPALCLMYFYPVNLPTKRPRKRLRGS